MTIINPTISIVVYSILLLCCALIITATTMSVSKMNKLFKCDKCGKVNKKLTGKCEHCGVKMNRWVGKFKSITRYRYDCTDDNGVADLKITRKAIMLEISFVALVTIYVVWSLTRNILFIVE